MRFLHSMVRVANLDLALDFYCNKLGLVEIRRRDNKVARFTLVFLAAPADFNNCKINYSPLLELTFNWDEKDYYSNACNFGHLAYEVSDIYQTCESLLKQGVVINRPPRDGRMAFIKSPDGISIELLQKGNALAPQQPWLSMPNNGEW